jgi:hypothetical protein
MAESTLFNKYLSNVRDTLFQPFVPGQKKSIGSRTMEFRPSDQGLSKIMPYYDKEYLAEQEGLRKHYDEGGAGPTGPDPDQIHYEEIQFDKWLNLDTVADIESNNTADARSKSGALGYFQIKPEVAKEPGYGITPLVTPDGTYTEEDVLNSSRQSQKDFARSYLQQVKFLFKDDKAKSLVAYNMGIGAAKAIEQGKRDISPEAIRYLEKYMLAGAVTREEVIKAYPKLKNHEKFKRKE